jgi:acetyl-CoA C-acetyltransferase
VILATDEITAQVNYRSIPVAAAGNASGRSAAYRYDDQTTFHATEGASAEAYDADGLGPADVDVIEIHDYFTPAKIGDSEDLGFFDKSQVAIAAREGRTAIDY